METLFLIIHLLSNIALVSALFVRVALINSKEQSQLQLRKKVSNLVAHPAMILGLLSGIYLITQLDGGMKENSWVNFKILFFMLLVIAQVLVTLKTKSLSNLSQVSKKFIIAILSLIIIALVGAITTVVVFQESEDKNSQKISQIISNPNYKISINQNFIV